MIPWGRSNVVSFERHLQRRRQRDAQLLAARSNYYFGRWSVQLRAHLDASYDRLADCLRELQAKDGPDEWPR